MVPGSRKSRVNFVARSPQLARLKSKVRPAQRHEKESRVRTCYTEHPVDRFDEKTENERFLVVEAVQKWWI